MSVSIYYQNVRGMRTKTEDVLNNILINNYSVIVFTETWLNCNIMESEFVDDRYVVYRRDRSCSSSSKRDGGGVMIAVSKQISSSRHLGWESNVEDLWVSINVKSNNTVMKISICAVYLPPPVSFESLSCFLENCSNGIDKSDNVILLGDFNLGFIGWSRESENGPCSATNYDSKLGLSLIDFMALNNLTQMNDVPNVDGRILDLVLSDLDNLRVAKSLDKLSRIDQKHPPVLISLLKRSPEFLKPALICRYNYFRADYSRIIPYLKSIDWHAELGECQNVNEMTDRFYNLLQLAIDSYVPKTKPKSTNYPSWFTHSLIKIIAEKSRKRLKYLKYKNPRDLIEFELLRERAHKVRDQCFFNFIKRIERDITRNPKSFWRFIKDRRNGCTSIPATMCQASQVATTGSEIAQLFANKFSSVFNKAIVSDDVGNIMVNDSFLNNVKLKEWDIIVAAKKLDIFKGAGPDEIPPVFVKRCSTAIALPLSIIFNRSLSDGVFPDIWKISKIVPVFKKGVINDVNNYRPISIISCIPKLFESLICPIITHHLSTCISEHQHGFRKGRSIETNLVSFMSYLCKEIDNRQEVDAIYMDFSSAFDKVCHSRLINKLKSYGICGSLLEWFRAYLAKRLQFVVVNGYKSDEYIATSGVPQGSHLAPILFIVFINDITSEIIDSKFCLFADDLKIYRTVNSLSDVEHIQRDLDRINVWCELNGMILNTKKSFHVKFSRKLKSFASSYKLNSDKLEQVKEVRDLGVIMDSKLTFKSHIDAIVIKAGRMLGFLKRNTKGFMSNRSKIILYNCLVRSQLEFATVVWNPQYITYSQRIESVQRSFTRYLAFHSPGFSHRATYNLRLKHFEIMSLGNRRVLFSVLFLKKIICGIVDCSHLLQSLYINIPYNYPRYPSTKSFYIPISRTNLLKNSPLLRICDEYNRAIVSTDIDIFHDSCLAIKKKLSTYLLSK